MNQAGSAVKTFIGALILCGVVVGLWRVLGDGHAPWDAAFYPAAEHNLTVFRDWLAGLFTNWWPNR